MRGLLIDPKAYTIQEIQLAAKGDHLPEIYRHLQCRTFDCAALDNRDTLYIDDEGLLKANPYHFIIEGCLEPFAGRGLILGTTNTGHSTDAHAALDTIKQRITFLTYLLPGVVGLRRANEATFRLRGAAETIRRIEKGETPC